MKKRLVKSAVALLPMAAAEEVRADAIYEFTGAEFSETGDVPDGIYVSAVPAADESS